MSSCLFRNIDEIDRDSQTDGLRDIQKRKEIGEEERGNNCGKRERKQDIIGGELETEESRKRKERKKSENKRREIERLGKRQRERQKVKRWGRDRENIKVI